MKLATRTTAVALASATAITLTGCSGSSSSSSSHSGASAKAGTKTITVLGAASLTESFKKLAAQFEKEHPDVKIKMSFAGSQDIARQLEGGANADVVAMADTATPKTLPADVSKGKTWTNFATNELEIATPKGNPKHVTGLSSLTKVNTVLCAKKVPCGRAADKALTKAKISAHVVSYEQNVKSTLAKVSAGDADAAIVYRTDVKASEGKVAGVEIPAAANIRTTLPIAVWSDNAEASAFVSMVTGAAGRSVLTQAGFGSPS